MQLTQSLAVLFGLAATTAVHGSPLLQAPVHGEAPEIDAKKRATTFDASTATLDEFASNALEVAKARIGNSSTCTPENVTVRKLWENLASDERIAYTSALNCLIHDKPARTPTSLAAGARSRYDDWIVTHINQTLTIHETASFLGWHRWFIWQMEQELRNECNYTGAIPYWDWTRTAREGFANSEMFDGSATSLSGDGLPLNYTDDDVVILNANTTGEVILPHGTGGGCVTNGPFANLTINFGPDGLVVVDNTTTDSSGWEFAYNPRCFKRDLTDYALTRYANETGVLQLLREPQDVYTFETLMQGYDGVPELGVHGGGHYALGGDPGRDVYVSPGDPAFWSHHAQIDRVWWMWQMQDPEARGTVNAPTALSGPLTFYNETAPYGNGTAATLQNIGYVEEGVEVPLGELLSTTEGMFCYVYE